MEKEKLSLQESIHTFSLAIDIKLVTPFTKPRYLQSRTPSSPRLSLQFHSGASPRELRADTARLKPTQKHRPTSSFLPSYLPSFGGTRAAAKERWKGQNSRPQPPQLMKASEQCSAVASLACSCHWLVARG